MSKKIEELRYLVDEAAKAYDEARQKTEHAFAYEGQLSPRMVTPYFNEVQAARRYISTLLNYLEAAKEAEKKNKPIWRFR